MRMLLLTGCVTALMAAAAKGVAQDGDGIGFVENRRL